MRATTSRSGICSAGARGPSARAVLAILVALLVILLPAPTWAAPAPAWGAPTSAASATPTPSSTAVESPDDQLVAVEIAWAGDSAADFADRLGAPAALYAVDLHLPLTGTATVDLHNIGLQAAAQGSGLVLTVRPHAGLEPYDETAARTTALAVAQATAEVEGPVLVRFGPQMNTPWVGWGMQPTAYVEAFRATAEALREEAPDAQIVWSPQTLEGYPFPMDRASPARQTDPGAGQDARLDTNLDGRLDSADDAYSPFYPGDDWVDWVGLTVL